MILKFSRDEIFPSKQISSIDWGKLITRGGSSFYFERILNERVWVARNVTSKFLFEYSAPTPSHGCDISRRRIPLRRASDFTRLHHAVCCNHCAKRDKPSGQRFLSPRRPRMHPRSTVNCIN